MSTVTIVLQIIVAIGLLNVWLIRSNQNTPYRGGEASSLKDEFIAYGLPIWVYYTIGVLKVGCALLLLVGIWFPSLVFPTAFVVSALMIGALAMHFKIRDPWKKYVPALIMLVFSLCICLGSLYLS